MSSEYTKSFFASFLSFLGSYNWLFVQFCSIDCLFHTTWFVWNYSPDWRLKRCICFSRHTSLFLYSPHLLLPPKEKYSGLWVLPVKMLSSLESTQADGIPLPGSPGEAVIQYWPTQTNSRDNTNPCCCYPGALTQQSCACCQGARGAERKRKGKKTPCPSSGSCTGIRMEPQSDQCSENNHREAARKSDLLWGSISACQLGQESVQTQQQRCCSSPSSQESPSPRGTTAPFLWGSQSQQASSHLCPQALTGFVPFTQLNFCVVPQGKAKIPPVATVRKEKKKSEKDTMQWIFAKKNKCSAV